MKKLLQICLTVICAFFMFAFTSSEGFKKINSDNETYNIRLGYKNLDGTLTLNTATESPGFIAENTETGELTYISNQPSSPGSYLPSMLPGIVEDLPAGTYTFSAERGQGNWSAWHDVTVTLSPNLVDGEGYITIYLPFAWSE